MLQDKEAYDVALEHFSVPLLPLVEYKLDYQGRMTVQNETALRYRFIDLTAQTEALFTFVERVIETDLVQELDFLRNYDTAHLPRMKLPLNFECVLRTGITLNPPLAH